MTSSSSIQADFEWLKSVINLRLEEFQHQQFSTIPKPNDLSEADDSYARLVNYYGLSTEERLFLILGLAPHFSPEILDLLFIRNPVTDRTFTEFGGVLGKNHNGILPTADTAIFLIAGNNILTKISIRSNVTRGGTLFRENLMQLEDVPLGEPEMSGKLIITDECLQLLVTGNKYKPRYSNSFPAQLIDTKLEWNDLVLEYDTLEALHEMKAWIEHGHQLSSMPGLGRKIKRGYRCLFYGPPGTGKTLTASLLGKLKGLDVYRIDLSMVVSKYIGETEKNLKNIFDQAEHRNWILFFDEADALFGKRTQTNSSNDRYANQEVSYLLQRIEDFPGLVILASNLKNNMDEAFIRRFQSMIYFPMPNADLRLDLWKKAFAEGLQLSENINLNKIAHKYELAGGAISNILRYCALMCLARGTNVVELEDLEEGIYKELRKEGKTVYTNIA